MKVVCIHLRASVVQSARSHKRSRCGLRLLSLTLGMSHLQKLFHDAWGEDLFWREFSYSSVSFSKEKQCPGNKNNLKPS